MKLFLLLTLLTLSFLSFGDVCRGELNFQLIKEGKKSHDDLSHDENGELLLFLYGRKCNSNGTCGDAYSRCIEDCSEYNFTNIMRLSGMPNYESDCKKACSSGEYDCKSSKKQKDRCDEFQDECKSTCESEFSSYNEADKRALEHCNNACSKGAFNCF